jgi:hypothetical protein
MTTKITQQAVTVSIAYAREAAFGTAAAAASGKLLRRVQSTLATSKDTFASNEVRTDQQIADLRHGLHKVGGTVACELSTASFDDLIESLLRGRWAAGVTAAPGDFTSITASNANSTFTNASGSWLDKGFKRGDVVRFTNLPDPYGANNNKNFRITNATAAAITVFPAPIDMPAEVSFAVAVVGQKLTVGTEQDSYTIEQANPDIGVSEIFTGCRVDKGQFKLPVNGMATVDLDFMGQDGQVLSGASSPYFIAPTAAPTTGILAGPSGSVSIGGVAQGVVTALDFTVAHSCTAPAVVGSVIAPNIYYGRTEVTGTLSAYLQDQSLLAAFLGEQETDVAVQLDAAPPADGSAPDFLCFGFHRIKFTGATKTVAGDGGVVVQLPFTALLANSTTSPDLDGATMVIQRSNA